MCQELAVYFDGRNLREQSGVEVGIALDIDPLQDVCAGRRGRERFKAGRCLVAEGAVWAAVKSDLPRHHGVILPRPVGYHLGGPP